MTNYSQLRKAGLLSGTIKNATAKRRHRDKLACATVPQAGYVPIPLGAVDSAQVGSLARAKRPRVQRWTGARARWSRRGRRKDAPDWGIEEIDCGRYSRGCTFRVIDYAPWVASYGYTTGTRLIATVWGTRYRYRAPRGWVFGRDDLGIYLVRVRETRVSYRYHLTSDDVRGGVAAIRAAGIRHETGQRAAKRAAITARRLADADALTLQRVGVFVSIDDSRAAGNCVAGTIKWGTRHGLDHAKCYPVEVIERLAATHPSVSRVIDAAKRRTLDDVKRGQV
jgi:hypothetical protein